MHKTFANGCHKFYDIRKAMLPEPLVSTADQTKRGLWGREWFVCILKQYQNFRNDFRINPTLVMHTVLKIETKAKTVELQSRNINDSAYIYNKCMGL